MLPHRYCRWLGMLLGIYYRHCITDSLYWGCGYWFWLHYWTQGHRKCHLFCGPWNQHSRYSMEQNVEAKEETKKSTDSTRMVNCRQYMVKVNVCLIHNLDCFYYILPTHIISRVVEHVSAIECDRCLYCNHGHII